MARPNSPSLDTRLYVETNLRLWENCDRELREIKAVENPLDYITSKLQILFKAPEMPISYPDNLKWNEVPPLLDSMEKIKRLDAKNLKLLQEIRYFYVRKEAFIKVDALKEHLPGPPWFEKFYEDLQTAVEVNYCIVMEAVRDAWRDQELTKEEEEKLEVIKLGALFSWFGEEGINNAWEKEDR